MFSMFYVPKYKKSKKARNKCKCLTKGCVPNFKTELSYQFAVEQRPKYPKQSPSQLYEYNHASLLIMTKKTSSIYFYFYFYVFICVIPELIKREKRTTQIVSAFLFDSYFCAPSIDLQLRFQFVGALCISGFYLKKFRL